MSKKPAPNRLNQLFQNLEALEPLQQPDTQVEPSTGWYWESDDRGNYLSCSDEVMQILGIAPGEFRGQPIHQFCLHPESAIKVFQGFQQNRFPTEIEVIFFNASGSPVPARLTILTQIAPNGRPAHWQGFTQVLASDELNIQASELPVQSDQEQRAAPVVSQKMTGIAIEDGSFRAAGSLWTQAGQQSLQQKKIVAQTPGQGTPSAIAVPFTISKKDIGVLEIIDEDESRHWNEDERLLVQEVANQLALALENADLYQTVQQELTERIRAEKEIRDRNADLAMLNQAGQQLSRLTSAEEIYELLCSIIGQMFGSENLVIAVYHPNKREVAYPIYVAGGARQKIEPQPLGNDLAGYLYWTKKPLLLSRNVGAELVERGVNLPEKTPAAVLAIPMMAGERPVGAIIVQDEYNTDAFSAVHSELLSTLASQATTALENANLFNEIRGALSAIENRERYQANVALVAATLSKYGSKSLPEVLASLGTASLANRVFYAYPDSESGEDRWLVKTNWVDETHQAFFDSSRSEEIHAANLPYVRDQLRETGWIARLVNELPQPDRQFFAGQGVQSVLILSVPGKGNLPGFTVFEQVDREREWQLEEVRILQVATDALSNTILRETLLKQVQTTLHDTELLYNMSHSMALAAGVDEMISLIAANLRDPAINRYVLVTFERDEHGEITAMPVTHTYSNGGGTPPPPTGSSFAPAVFGSFFQQSSALYIEDVHTAHLPVDIQAAWEKDQIGSIALFPLWLGKQQIGVFYTAGETSHVFSEQLRRYTPPLIDQLATAIENQRLFQETEKALANTGLLYEISSALSAAADSNDLVEIVRKQLMPARTDRISLIQVNPNSDGEPADLEVIGAYDAGGGRQQVGMRLPVTSLPVVRNISDEAIAIRDIQNSALDPVTRRTLTQFNVAAACFVPLRSAGKLVGALMVSARQPVDFQKEELNTLQVAANGMAVALEKQRLLREAQRRALELQTAAEIARDTTNTLALDNLLSRIVALLCERFNFYHASIFLLDQNRTHAVVRESTGEAGKDMKTRGHKLAVGSKSVVGTVTASGEPLIISDTSKSPIYFPNPLLPDTRSEMGIPLKLGTQVIGALDIQSTQANAFTMDDVAVLQILSDQIAIAIENARAYELSQKAVDEMREVDRMKSQFLANMSHELRTPLNSIIGFSKVILKGIDGPINETQNQDLNAIYNSGQHLLNLINDILDLSKIEAGKMELTFGEVQIGEVVTSVMSTAVGLVKGKPVKLVPVIPPDLPPARADATRVRQVLLNFISNAAKFTDEGAITVEASIVKSPKGRREMMLTVTDSGAGIAPEDTHKLFQPFSQVDDSPTRKTGGTGLGLSICRSLIDMHGGRIGLLRSEIGKGSTFYFTLPLLDEPDPVPAEPAEADPGTIILAIDDDAQVIELYERYLRPQGYRVIPLTDPKQAVEKAKEVKPTVITLDVMMPEKDGWQVMVDLKNDPQTRGIPVIICSILEEEEKGFSFGAADYLVKPFVQEDLINAINRINPEGTIHEVLVIDDSADDLRLVQKMIEESSQYRVLPAEGGQAGWEVIQSKPPDAIIVDLFMPDLNGFQILERLRADTVLSKIPVIVLTGADLTLQQRETMREFGQQLLAKGQLNEKALLHSLESSLKRYQPR